MIPPQNSLWIFDPRVSATTLKISGGKGSEIVHSRKTLKNQIIIPQTSLNYKESELLIIMQPFVGVGQVVLTYAGFKGILRVFF